MKRIASLMRVSQWYKNLLVFLPIIFGEQLANMATLEKTFLGFISLCLISSANYILNDIIDRKRDLYHPNSRNKHIATGKVKVWHAFLLAAAAIAASLYLASYLSMEFLYFVIALFVLTQMYSLRLKKEIFLDVITISSNFVLRAVAGAYIIMEAGKPYIWVSPWLIVCTFFLALLLATGKRSSELRILKEKAPKYRPVLRLYTPGIADALLHVSTGILIVAYTLYSFMSVNPSLIYTTPIALYAILRYLYLVESGSRIPLQIHTLYSDKRLLMAAFLWIASVIVIVYIL